MHLRKLLVHCTISHNSAVYWQHRKFVGQSSWWHTTKESSYFSFTMSLIARVFSIEVKVHLHHNFWHKHILSLHLQLSYIIPSSPVVTTPSVQWCWHTTLLLSLVISVIEGGVQVHYNGLVPRDSHSFQWRSSNFASQTQFYLKSRWQNWFFFFCMTEVITILLRNHM